MKKLLKTPELWLLIPLLVLAAFTPWKQTNELLGLKPPEVTQSLEVAPEQSEPTAQLPKADVQGVVAAIERQDSTYEASVRVKTQSPKWFRKRKAKAQDEVNLGELELISRRQKRPESEEDP